MYICRDVSKNVLTKEHTSMYVHMDVCVCVLIICINNYMHMDARHTFLCISARIKNIWMYIK